MRSSLSQAQLASYLAKQLNSYFPDDNEVTAEALIASVKFAQSRLEHCFSHVNNKYFFDGKQVVFNHLHGDQYAMWLYFVSNQLFRDGAATDLCSKVFLLNKALHGCDIYFEVELPSVFLLVHPLGTVLGRGNYADYFVAYQRCGVGSNHDIYPNMSKYFTLRPGSSILGNSSVGINCTLAAESLLLDEQLEDNTMYVGNPSNKKTFLRTEQLGIWRNCDEV